MAHLPARIQYNIERVQSASRPHHDIFASGTQLVPCAALSVPDRPFQKRLSMLFQFGHCFFLGHQRFDILGLELLQDHGDMLSDGLDEWDD